LYFKQEGYIGGALVIDGQRIRVYKPGTNSFKYIVCPVTPLSVIWAGETVQVTLENGWTRLYSGDTMFKQLPPPPTFKRKQP